MQQHHPHLNMLMIFLLFPRSYLAGSIIEDACNVLYILMQVTA